MSKPSYKILSAKYYHNSEPSEKAKDFSSSDQSRSKFSSKFGDQSPLTTPYQVPFDCSVPNHFWLDKMADGDWRQENFICVMTPHSDVDDFQVIQLELNQDYSLSLEALVQQFPKATGLYYYNPDNSLCGVPQNQEKLFPPSSGNQTFYFTELGCNCSDWVRELKDEINQLSHLKGQVDLLEEEIKASKASYNNSMSQLKGEIKDMKVEMKQLKESNLKEVSMLKQELNKMKLKENKEISSSKNQLKQEALNRKEQIKKEMYNIESTVKEMKEEINNIKEELVEIKINNQDITQIVDQSKGLDLRSDVYSSSNQDSPDRVNSALSTSFSDKVIKESEKDHHTCNTRCSCMSVQHGSESKPVDDKVKEYENKLSKDADDKLNVYKNKLSNDSNCKASWVPLEERPNVDCSVEKCRSFDSKLGISKDKNYVESFRPKLAKNSSVGKQKRDGNDLLATQSKAASTKSTNPEKMKFYGMKGRT